MFGNIKRSWKEARGRLLFEQCDESLSKLLNGNSAVLVETTAHLISGYIKIQERLYNLSQKGRSDLGKELQSMARAHFDNNVSLAYGKWLLGAWLETEGLPGRHARKAHTTLATLLESLNRHNLSPECLYSAYNKATIQLKDREARPRSFEEALQYEDLSAEEMLALLDKDDSF